MNLTTEEGNTHRISDNRLDGEWAVIIHRTSEHGTAWIARLDFVGTEHRRSIKLTSPGNKDGAVEVRDIVAGALKDMMDPKGLTPKGHNIDIPFILERKRLEAEGEEQTRDDA